MTSYKHLFPVLTVLLLLLAGLTSCDNGCEQTRENYLHVAFTSHTGRVMKSIDFILTTYGEGDGYIMPGVKQFDNVELDLNPNDSVTFMLITGSYTDFGDSFQVSDTVRIDYTTQPYYLDMNCGCAVHYEIKSIESTHNLFTRIKIVDPIVVADTELNMVFEY